jgi:hypothetical protein
MSAARLGRLAALITGLLAIAARACGAGQVFVQVGRWVALLGGAAPAVISYSSVGRPIRSGPPVRRRAWEQLLPEVIAYTRARADIAQR